MTRRYRKANSIIILLTAITAAGGILCFAMVCGQGQQAKAKEEVEVIFEPIPKTDSFSNIEDIQIQDEEIQDETLIQGAGRAAGLDITDSIEFAPLPVDMSVEDQEVVYSICREYNIAFPLVMAMIEHESQFDRLARSETGDSGYMQINDCNVDALAEAGFEDLFLLEDNIGAGCHMLRELFDKYPGDTTFVLMCYNAGEKGAKEQIAAGITETEYTNEIETRAKEFSDYIDAAFLY